MLASALLLTAVLFSQTPAAPSDVLVEPSTDIKFQRRPTIDGEPYLCLGSGVRKKAIFKVYAIVFCAQEKQLDEQITRYFEGPGQKYAALKGPKLAEALQKDPAFYKFLVTTPAPKLAELSFVRNVGKKKMQESFTEGLTKALGPGEQQRIANFVALLDRDIKEGDRLMIRTSPDGAIRMQLDHEPKAVDDPKLVFGIWEAYLGPDSVSPALKASVARGAAEQKP